MSDMTFGKYLRRCRKADRVTLSSVARALDMTHVYISKVERDMAWPLKPHYFDKLCELIPSLGRLELETLYVLAQIERLKVNGYLDGLEHVMICVTK